MLAVLAQVNEPHGTADALDGFCGANGLREFCDADGLAVCCCPDGIELPTLLNALLAFVPSVVTAIRHGITMAVNMAAYSTAVGPSSDARKRRMNRCIIDVAASGEAVVMGT